MKQLSNAPSTLSKQEFNEIVRSKRLRVELAKESPYWFFHIYFPDYIQAPTAPFQREMFHNLSYEEIRHLVIVSFRGSAKSTIVTTVFPIWSIISGRKKFALIVSQTQPQAQQHLRNLREELEHNELFREDFGHLKEETGEWGLAALSLTKYKAKIMCASRGQSVRGLRHHATRPDLIICDDIEDVESVKTIESRNETFRWFNAEIMGVGDMNTQYVTVGNLLHEDSLVMRLKDSFAAGTRTGKYTQYPISVNGRSMWPGMYPDEKALKLRQSDFDYQTWMREFMLVIIPNEDQVVTKKMLHMYDTIPELLRGQSSHLYVGVDLAISDKSSADYTAAVSLIVRDVGTSKMQMYVLPHPINKRLSFNQIKDAMTEIHEGYKGTIFVIETIAAQDYVAQSLRSDGLKVIGVKPQIGKRERLNVIADAITRGKVKFPQTGCELLLAQLTGYGVEKHDDLMDAFVTAVLEILDVKAKKTGTVTFSGQRVPRVRGSSGSTLYTRSQYGNIIKFDDPYGR